MVEQTSQPEQPAAPDSVVVRYGVMGLVGEFRNSPGLPLQCGTRVIIQTDRGMEIGQMVSPICGSDACGLSVKRDHVRNYVRASGPENCQMNAGKVLRLAEPADIDEAAHIARSNDEMMAFCQQKADEMKLDMRVIDVEHIFGGERVVFYFQSENRIDFRGLVKDLAHEYQTRIEMRQIGARDEARLLADYEICGRQCCCKNFLKNLKPVNMRMAKTQKATLDPNKVSGRCGRLRCCLRFENEVYDELDRKLPKMNHRIRVPDGIGRVVDRQILTQLLRVELESDGRRVVVPLEEVLATRVRDDEKDDRPAPSESRGGRGDRGGRDQRGGRGRGDRTSASPVEPRREAPSDLGQVGSESEPSADTGPSEGDRPSDSSGEQGGGGKRSGRRRRRRRKSNRSDGGGGGAGGQQASGGGSGESGGGSGEGN